MLQRVPAELMNLDYLSARQSYWAWKHQVGRPEVFSEVALQAVRRYGGLMEAIIGKGE